MAYELKDSRFQFSAWPDGKYAAAQSSRLRKRPKSVLKHEDDHLPQKDRDRIQSMSWDEQRNFAIAGWVVRKHLDFVAEHNFDARTGDKTLDDDIEGLITEWSEPENFDIRGRHGLQDHIRIDEACRTVGGDILLQKIRSGALIQAIEADRIRDPEKPLSDRWRNGVLENRAGKATHYSIHRRGKNGRFEFERILKADEVYHFGYFTRHDQARGNTPISCSLNHLRQVGRGVDYALGRMLIGQIFGIWKETDDPQTDEINLQDGPFFAEVGIGEKLNSLMDKNPSLEFDNFMRHVISMIAKSLDLPYSFYQENFTNFFGSRAALILYLQSCRFKRRAVQALLRHLTKWRLNWEIAESRLRLPRSLSLNRVCRGLHWIPVGLPWWNPAVEASAAEKLIKLRLRSRAEIRRETHGDSWWDLQDSIDAEEQRIANSLELAV